MGSGPGYFFLRLANLLFDPGSRLMDAVGREGVRQVGSVPDVAHKMLPGLQVAVVDDSQHETGAEQGIVFGNGRGGENRPIARRPFGGRLQKGQAACVAQLEEEGGPDNLGFVGSGRKARYAPNAAARRPE